MNNKNKSTGFTMVELIISITILVLIWVIGFISFSSHLNTTRDSSRVELLTNIESNLLNYKISTGYYPDPSSGKNVIYSGATLWTQWTFWFSVIKKMDWSISKVEDPYTKNEYTYSIKNTRKEFQLAWVLEWEEIASNSLVSWAYAVNNNELKSIVRWDYNWKMISVRLSWVTYILSIPSIISTSLDSLEIDDIIQGKHFVYNNYSNLPESYKDVYTVDNWIDFSTNQLLLFSWSINDLKIEANRLSLVENIYNSYIWNTLEYDDDLINTLKSTNLNFITPSKELLNIVCDVVNEKLKFKTDCL